MADDSGRATTAPARGWLHLVLTMFATAAAFALGIAAALLFLRPARDPKPEHETVLRSTSTIVSAIRDLAVLETSSYHLEHVIDLRDRQSRMFGLVSAQDAILLVAAGDVVAGVDLASMKSGDIQIDPKTQVAYVTLPAPIVLSARLDNERTYVHTRKTDVLAERVDSLETRARQEAERSLRDAAIRAGILERAGRNAARTIETLVRSLGFARVEVELRRE